MNILLTALSVKLETDFQHPDNSSNFLLDAKSWHSKNVFANFKKLIIFLKKIYGGNYEVKTFR